MGSDAAVKKVKENLYERRLIRKSETVMERAGSAARAGTGQVRVMSALSDGWPEIPQRTDNLLF